MSSDHSSHEDGETHATGCGGVAHPATAADVGSPPADTMSRADLLRTLGGGVALALTATSLPASVAQAAAPAAPIEPAPGPQHAEYVCLIVLDGGRPDYITNNLSALPNLRSLVQRGRWYNRAWVGNLMSITPPGHAVIGTGSFPKNDGGIVNWDWGIHSTGKISPTTQALENYQNGWVFNLMKQSGTPTLSGVIRKKYPNDPVIAGSGAHFHAAGPQADAIMYYHGDYSGRYVPVAIPNHMPPLQVLSAPGLIANTTHLAFGQDDAYATKLALSALTVMHPRITLINYPEFDWPLGHVYGANTDRPAVIGLMKQFDQDLGQIEDVFRKRHVLRKTLFVITADHGMAPVSRFVPSTVIKNAISKAGTTAPTITSTTASYIWLRDRTKARAVAQNILLARDPGIQSVYYLTGTGTAVRYVRPGGAFVNSSVEAAHQYLLLTLVNSHEPNVVAFCRANTTTANTATKWKADHGGASWGSQHIPLILAGAGIRSGIVTGEPAQLEDVAPTVLTALGIAPTGMEGHVLNEALRNPAPTDWNTRVAEATQLTPLIQGLVAQDKYETSHP